MEEDDPRLELAIERTELALERTHLAWVRTVIALIASGFAIDQLVEIFRAKRITEGTALVRQAHFTGLLLTLSGTVLMIVATMYYLKRRRELAKRRHAKLSWYPPGIFLSLMIFLVGLTLIYLVLKD